MNPVERASIAKEVANYIVYNILIEEPIRPAHLLKIAKDILLDPDRGIRKIKDTKDVGAITGLVVQ